MFIIIGENYMEVMQAGWPGSLMNSGFSMPLPLTEQKANLKRCFRQLTYQQAVL